MDFTEYQEEIIEDIKSCLESLQVQPILFMGAGISQRYIKAPDWEGLLKKLAETCPLIKRPYGYYSQTKGDNKPLIASDFVIFMLNGLGMMVRIVIQNHILKVPRQKIFILSMKSHLS
ncbi:hypothetical protein ED048_11795 [Salmonella enterica subsp. enterica serovar Typhimurium]|nr:hypothetical protein ED048_11795 [Salmonella enterica subsp. enterica serovar Typhimurium]